MTFRTSWPLKIPHIQTILPLLIPKKSTNYLREDFVFKDGDFTEIVWSEEPTAKTYKKVCVLFHGLGGSSESHYIQGMMQSLSKEGYLCVLMHFRSCGMKPNKALRMYHAGETEDAREFIQMLSQRFKEAEIYSIGYSLGANMLLKLLNSYGKNSPLSGAVSVSAPLELGTCTHYINKGVAKVYQGYLLKILKRELLTKAKQLDLVTSLNLSIPRIKKIKTIFEFDDIYTAPANGFKDAYDYYAKNSAKQFLKGIKVPTLLIHSKDDPFMPSSIVPDKTEVSACVDLLISDNGGHVGFIKGSIFKPNFWLEDRVKSFFNEQSHS
ncbi:MAG TPA: hydrolase [Sulfurimonas sp.]|nr:hydrolase [Sulfurimonas sp.]